MSWGSNALKRTERITSEDTGVGLHNTRLGKSGAGEKLETGNVAMPGHGKGKV